MPSQSELQFLVHSGDATKILHKRRQLFDIKERFQAEKARYDEKCKALKETEKDLVKRDVDFQAKVGRSVGRSTYLCK